MLFFFQTEKPKSELDPTEVMNNKETAAESKPEDKMVVPNVISTTLPPPLSSTMKDHTQKCKEKNMGSVLLRKFVKKFLSYFEKKVSIKIKSN